jgi:hypothetical protein
MGQFSVEISALPGSILNGNQHFNFKPGRGQFFVTKGGQFLMSLDKVLFEGPATGCVIHRRSRT